MAGDKCTHEAKPGSGLDGTGGNGTGVGSEVGGKKAGNGTYASPHSQYASKVGFRLKRCQGQLGFHVVAPALLLTIIIITITVLLWLAAIRAKMKFFNQSRFSPDYALPHPSPPLLYPVDPPAPPTPPDPSELPIQLDSPDPRHLAPFNHDIPPPICESPPPPPHLP